MKKKTRSQKIKILDALFSKHIRNKYAKNNMVACYTCGVIKPVKEMQNGHFISRACMYLRWSEENCRPQCVGCNIMKSGNYIEYTRKMIDELGRKKVDEMIAQKTKCEKVMTREIDEMIEKYSQ